jgi:hypothetical protein
MGEIDIISVEPSGFVSGGRYVFLTVFFTWLPLAIAGIVLGWKQRVHAAMRGAMSLRVLARLAITIQVGAVALPLWVLVGILGTFWSHSSTWLEVFAVVVIGSCVMLPIAAISGAGIVGWHRVLVGLASREGENRMLV